MYAYENYGTKEAPKGNADYVVSAKNILIARDANNKLGLTMPVKAYLSYDIYYTRGNELETINAKTQVGYAVTSAVNDVTIGADTTGIPITAPGVYRAVVVAEAANSLFGTSDQVVSEESVTVETLNAYGAAMTSVGYKDSADGKTVSIYFDGAYNMGTPVPTEYYKVYRSVRGKYDYTAVSGAVTKTKANANTFRIEDTVPDNTVDYIYTLVVTDGTRFASISKNTKEVSAFVTEQGNTSVNGTAANADNINLTADINWTITLPMDSSDDVTVEGVYILEKPLTLKDSTKKPCAADFDKADAKNLKAQLKPLVDAIAYNTNGYTVTTNHKDVNVYMLVTTSQENKKAGEWISAAVEVDVQPAEPSITAAPTTETGDKKVEITVTDNDSSSDYSYTLYRSVSQYNSSYATWTKVVNADLGTGKKNYSKTYTDTVSVADTGSTTYVYKVVKTWGDKKAESNKATVQVTESN